MSGLHSAATNLRLLAMVPHKKIGAWVSSPKRQLFYISMKET